MNQELTNNPFNPLAPQEAFDEIKVSLGITRAYSVVVIRGNQKARNHQLPYVQA